MHYHVSQDGKNIGKFTESDIYRNIRNGLFAQTDHYWTVGMPGWKPLSEFRPHVQQAQERAVAAPQPTSASRPYGGHESQPQHHNLSSHHRPNAVPEEKVQLFGYAGAVLLTLGTFGPFINMGILSLTLLQNWNWKGLIILACGVGSAVATYARAYKANWATASVPALLFAHLFFEFNKMSMGDDFGSKLARSIISPGWGLFVMILGVASLFICAWLSLKPMKRAS